jgi:ribonuclease D
MDQPLKYFKNPTGGIPEIIGTESALEQTISKLASAPGPIAIDAERASGYTYTQRAYLLQIKKSTTETFLIDPILEINYQALQQLLNENAWILHAATQDLPCLLDFNLQPKEIFDTELAARLLGLPRVGLGGLLEDRLKVTIDKAHSAVNWATRPLKNEWLSYAALDVEFLHNLQEDLTTELIEHGKYQIALEEFENLLTFKPTTQKPDAWRATSGMHKIRNNQEAAIVRELWLARDELAREKNLAPHRVIRDDKIIQLALEKPKSKDSFNKIFKNKNYDSSHLDTIYQSYLRAMNLSEENWPTKPPSLKSHPPARVWKEKYPEKFQILELLKHDLITIAESMLLPLEHLISPEIVKSFAWTQPQLSEQQLRQWLIGKGVRNWQADLVLPTFLNSLDSLRVK